MKAKDIVKELMKMRGHTNQSLADKLNYPHASGISQRLRGEGDMSVSTLLKFLEAMDCELVIKSTLSDKSVWVVDSGEEPSKPKPKPIDLDSILPPKP